MENYFTIKELIRSDTATALKIDNVPQEKEIFDNITYLIQKVLNPLRELYGKPIYVSSGYRCNELNIKVGGVRTSQHVKGQAVDIYVKNSKGEIDFHGNRKLFDLAVKHRLPFDQIILEKGTKTSPHWVHISYDKNRQRGQKLYYNGRSYVKV